MALLSELERALVAHGLILRGGFRPNEGDGAPEGARTLLLIGNAGPAMWRAFAARAPAGPDPLDGWIREVMTPLAARFGASPLYPFGEPPYWPFQRWAMKAEPVHPSPLGILIHPRYGLWHAYRAALAFTEESFPLPKREPGSHPCTTCRTRPCLGACPVGAFARDGYEVASCRAHIAAPAGRPCHELSCLARAACPIGRDHAYLPAQARFHMAAFGKNGI